VAEPPFYVPPGVKLSQGDIFEDCPSLEIRERPILVARKWPNKTLGQPPLPVYREHHEDQEKADKPQGGFHWTLEEGGGEAVISTGYKARAILLTHDCEVDNDPDFRVLAMIRPLSAVDAGHQEEVVNFGVWPYFPLSPQDEAPVMGPSFVDFRRLTTVHVDALRMADRFASLNTFVREALARRFQAFLFRRVLEGDE
jgi:hypothetical protein